MECSERGDDELKYCYKYPRPSVTTDCVVFGFSEARLSVLLVRRGAEPFKDRWAFPGGFMEIDESAEEGVRRELREETGLECGRVRQFHAFTSPGRDPRGRVMTVAFYALVRPESVCGGDDAADARWFALDAVPALAFDHDEVLRTALVALRRDAFSSLSVLMRFPRHSPWASSVRFARLSAAVLRLVAAMSTTPSGLGCSCRPKKKRNCRAGMLCPVSASIWPAIPF